MQFGWDGTVSTLKRTGLSYLCSCFYLPNGWLPAAGLLQQMPSPGLFGRGVCSAWPRPRRFWSFFLCPRQAGAQGGPSSGRVDPDSGCWCRKHHLEAPGLLGGFFLVRIPLGHEVHHGLRPPPACLPEALTGVVPWGCALLSARRAHVSTPVSGLVLIPDLRAAWIDLWTPAHCLVSCTFGEEPWSLILSLSICLVHLLHHLLNSSLPSCIFLSVL